MYMFDDYYMAKLLKQCSSRILTTNFSELRVRQSHLNIIIKYLTNTGKTHDRIRRVIKFSVLFILQIYIVKFNSNISSLYQLFQVFYIIVLGRQKYCVSSVFSAWFTFLLKVDIWSC